MKRFGAISGLRTWLLPMNKLRLVAPTNVLDAASRVTTALTTTALYTTDPLAQQVARKAAGEELGELHQRLQCGGRQAPVHRSFARSLRATLGELTSATGTGLETMPWHATQRLSLQVGTHCISTFHMSNGRVDVYTPGHLYITRPARPIKRGRTT